MKKALLPVVLSIASLVAPLTAAAETPAVQAPKAASPLAPAGAAGVKEAQLAGIPLFWIGVGIIAIGTASYFIFFDDNSSSSGTN